VKLLGYLYTSPLRSFLRKTGGIALYRSLQRRREPREAESVPEHFPSKEELVLAGQHIQVQCADAGEVRRARSMRSDARLIEALMGQLGAGDTFWDVGASLGVYTMIAARHLAATNGSVIAFEPEARSFQWLGTNIELNELRNVRTLNLALGSTKGEVDLAVTEFAGSGAHTLITANLGTESVGKQTVRIERGDSIAREVSLRPPNVVKIDVEGFEYDVLRGLGDLIAAPECKALLCEVHFAQLDQAGRSEDVNLLRARLSEAGFEHESWLDPSHLLALKRRAG
jgi:FkbM family methyltransferase